MSTSLGLHVIDNCSYGLAIVTLDLQEGRGGLPCILRGELAASSKRSSLSLILKTSLSNFGAYTVERGPL